MIYNKNEIPEDLQKYFVRAEIGLEATPEAFTAEMVNVFRDVRRVLRADGTLWLNLGDSYTSGGHSTWRTGASQNKGQHVLNDMSRLAQPMDLKPKDLVGIPWRMAFALQADGWYLRQDIIWSKPNPMPESVTDRCTKAHEYIFLLSKSERYYFDQEAIADPAVNAGRFHPSRGTASKNRQDVSETNDRRTRIGLANLNQVLPETRNKRSVWEVATSPFADAHFATFPPELIKPCILAGTSEKGCCGKCGAPWVRETERTAMVIDRSERTHDKGQTRSSGMMLKPPTSKTIGWSPSCQCNAPAVPCTVLDPFGGAGTTGLVADRLKRNAILIELNESYAEMAKRRIETDAGMFSRVDLEAERRTKNDAPLFAEVGP